MVNIGPSREMASFVSTFGVGMEGVVGEVLLAENRHTGTRQTAIPTLDLSLDWGGDGGKSRTFREPCPFSIMSLPRVVVVRYVGKPIEFSVVVEQGGRCALEI